jgi:OOP family OmpA-OmpF porin
MKLKLTLVLSLIILFTNVFAQKTKSSMGSKKPQLLGVNFLLVDFNSVNGIKSPGTGKGYSSVKNMSKGLGFSYWKGLTSTVDFSAKLNAIFNNYNLNANGLSDKTELGIELEPTINIRPMGDNAKLAPFLTTGVGVGYYTSDFGAYIPAGVGLQLNCSSTTYFILQAQYRFSLTKKVLGDNLFYSFGIAENF